jgi:hypothetical protein
LSPEAVDLCIKWLITRFRKDRIMFKNQVRQLVIGLALLLSLLGGSALGPATVQVVHTSGVHMTSLFHPDCPGLPCG